MNQLPAIESEPNLGEFLDRIIDFFGVINLDSFDKEKFISELDKLIGVLSLEENSRRLGDLSKIKTLWNQVKEKLTNGEIDINLFHQLKTAVSDLKDQAQISFL